MTIRERPWNSYYAERIGAQSAECASVITGGGGETSESLGTNRTLLMLQCVHVMRAVVGNGEDEGGQTLL